MKIVLLTIGVALAVAKLPIATQAQQDDSLPPRASLQAEDTTLIDDTNEVGKAWRQLFNGNDLNGWEQQNGTATYEVVDGTICGTTATGSPNSFLCTQQKFADFELVFEVKVDAGLNSGVQVRSHSKPGFKKGRVHGPQVEIESDPGESGYLYSEGTDRGWISPNRPQRKVFKNDDWNHYRVLAKGNRIQTWLNGTSIEDILVSEEETQAGFIGLQVHGIKEGSGPFQVRWRNIKIREIPAKAAGEADRSSDDQIEDDQHRVRRENSTYRINE